MSLSDVCAKEVGVSVKDLCTDSMLAEVSIVLTFACPCAFLSTKLFTSIKLHTRPVPASFAKSFFAAHSHRLAFPFLKPPIPISSSASLYIIATKATTSHDPIHLHISCRLHLGRTSSPMCPFKMEADDEIFTSSSTQLHKQGTNTWALGPSKILVRINDPINLPETFLTSWWDNNEIYYLRERTHNNTCRSRVSITHASQSSTSKPATYSLGKESHLEIHPWSPDHETIRSSILFINSELPSIPTPKIRYSWTSEAESLPYTITQRIHGRSLAQRWPTLNIVQRSSIIEQIAGFIQLMAKKTIPYFQTSSGLGVAEESFMIDLAYDRKCPLPRTFDPCTATQLKCELCKLSINTFPPMDETFVFHHANLCMSNILVSDDGERVVGVLGWEHAAFYPRFWISMGLVWKSARTMEEDEGERMWSRMLCERLQVLGFVNRWEEFCAWKEGMVGGLDDLSGWGSDWMED